MAAARSGLIAACLLVGAPALRVGAQPLLVDAQAGRADVPIAVAAPLSGHHAAEGKAILASVEWAVAALNARGGADGAQFVVRAEDDGCDERRAEAAARKLVEQRPAVVIGHPCGGPAQAAARIYAAAGTLFIAAAPRHPDLTRRRAGPTIFRLAGRDDRQSASTAVYLASAYTGKRLAIVHDRTRYARLLVDGLKRARGATAAEPVAELGIVASSKDYAATVATLRAARAEVVYFAGFPSEAAALWGQFLPADTPPDLVGSDALANADTELRALSAGARFATHVLRPYTATDADTAKPLADRLAAAGHVATPNAIAAHAAVEIWAHAAVEAGSRDAATVSRQLQSHAAPSLLGPVGFDAEGDARVPSFEVASFTDGRLAAAAIVLPDALAPATLPKAAQGQPAAATSAAAGAEAAAERVDRKSMRTIDSVPPLPVRHPLRRRRLPQT